MIDKGIITGSEEQAKPLIVGKDTVYVHTNIKKLQTDTDEIEVDELYQYHEIQYDKDEYITLMSDELTDAQLSLTDVDIHQIETEQSLTDIDIRLIELEDKLYE